jgi:predicted enzyme related to lactoylglutathione lyase
VRTPQGVFPYATIYVSVDDLRVSLDKAEEFGGKKVV